MTLKDDAGDDDILACGVSTPVNCLYRISCVCNYMKWSLACCIVLKWNHVYWCVSRSGRLFKHKQLLFSLYLSHSHSLTLNYEVRESVAAAGFSRAWWPYWKIPPSKPRHKPPSTSPSLSACYSIRLHVPCAVVSVRGLAFCAVNSCWCVL